MPRSPASSRSATRWWPPGTLAAALAPGVGFAVLLGLLARADARFGWVHQPLAAPWPVWTMAVAGTLGAAGAVGDSWFHRAHGPVVGRPEHLSHWLALVTGGLPLFAVMAWATLAVERRAFLVPVIVLAGWTVTWVAYDAFVFHRRRRTCPLERTFHGATTAGNGLAFPRLGALALGQRMSELLDAAEIVWNEHPHLREAAEQAWRRGFASGAEWMAEVRAAVLDTPPDSRAFHTGLARDNVLGVLKNGGSAALAGFAGAALFTRTRARLGAPAATALGVAAFVLGFYAVEGQMVFLFPILREAHERDRALSLSALLRECRARTLRAGGTLAVMRTVMPISAHMIFGGLLTSPPTDCDAPFLRSWCLGCIAVVLWHERVMAA